MTGWKRWTWRIGRILLVCYVLLCVLLVAVQRRMLYFPSPELVVTPADYGTQFANVSIPAANGGHLSGWWIPSKNPSAPTLIYFHGNGGNIGSNAEHASRLAKICCNVFIFDYRGYGASSGPFPSESRIYEDGEAAWHYVTAEKKIPASQIVLYGHSLGGGVAVEMAKRHPDAAALIVESSFTSIADRAAIDPLYRYFPVRLLTYQRFDSARKIAAIHMPTLVITGTADEIIPTTMTQKLYADAAGPKQLIIVEGAGHENCGSIGGATYTDGITQFLGPISRNLPQLTSR